MKLRRKVHNEKGVAAIEFAIVLPVLLLLLIGIVEFSLLLYDKAMITNASREGARAGIVYDAIDTNDDGVPDFLHPPASVIETTINTYLQNFLISFDPESPDIHINRYPDSTLTPGTELGYGAEESGDFLKVEIDYQYGFLLLPQWVSGLVGDINAVTVMRFE